MIDRGIVPPPQMLRVLYRLRSGAFGAPVLVGPIPAEGREPEEQVLLHGAGAAIALADTPPSSGFDWRSW